MAESIDIFLPILQLGCLSAISLVINLNLFKGYFLKGPPEAVIKTFSILMFLEFPIRDHIEKCSESIGIIIVLFFFAILLIMFQPQIIDSLFANKTFFNNSIEYLSKNGIYIIEDVDPSYLHKLTLYFENDFYVEVIRLKSNKFNLLKDNNLILIKHKNYA